LRFNRAILVVLCLLGAMLAMARPAYALFDARAEQARLAERIRLHPTDYEATYRYVQVSTELRDYEAAIGALERLLMFNPRLARTQKELGFLYARLGAYQVAQQHLRAALQSPELDQAQRAQIQAQLPDIEKRTEPSRLYGQFSAGLRAQSNANFFPLNGLFQVGGVGVSAAGKRSDVNAYQLLQAAHDLDFANQGVLETRASIYATQQFNLPLYNVGLFSGSVGPRFEILQDSLPGASVKPYVTGTVSSLGSDNYLDAGGGGVTLRFPVGPDATVEPGVEWRALYVNQSNPANGGFLTSSLSTLATGDVITGYVGGTYRATDNIRLDWQAAYSRANAQLASQSSDQVDVRAMLRLEFDPPFRDIGLRWTIAPYARFTGLAFDAANPLVNPVLARRDTAWAEGVLLTLPITGRFGLVGNVEYARNDSNLPNFRTENFSVSFGPVLRF
jgi:tetratricopeptide (TPR) repeat protein